MFDNWIIPHCIPSFLLNDNGPKIVAELFENLSLDLNVKQSATNAYHPQTNGEVERYYETLAARFCHYMAEHREDWDD